METMEAILSRRSVRSYTEQPISDALVREILEAGMSGPSCVNARDWSFIVVKDREKLNRMADANGGPAQPLRSAALGILICGDLQRAFSRAPEYWVIDCAIAGQNMILAAASFGIGSVWLGTWPQMNRVERQRELFQLPEHIVPHSIISFGWPQESAQSTSPKWEDDRVHYETW